VIPDMGRGIIPRCLTLECLLSNTSYFYSDDDCLSWTCMRPAERPVGIRMHPRTGAGPMMHRDPSGVKGEPDFNLGMSWFGLSVLGYAFSSIAVGIIIVTCMPAYMFASISCVGLA
jgi:hypothetical protein